MSKRLTTEEFIERAKKVHGDKYDYSLVEYKGTNTKVKIICPVHGVFEQMPSKHLCGQGCSKCSGKYHKTTEEFIKQARNVHGYKYDYSLVEYKNSHTKVKIICPVHGVFEQMPYSHLQGFGCIKCCGLEPLTTEEFIERASKVHGYKYDYSLVEYKNSATKVKIICPIHGIFEQIPSDHLSGHGCKDCRNDETGNRLRQTKEEFINKARSIHGDKYDYSLVEYKNNNTKVKIICPEHGIFLQKPNDHLSGHGCIKCAGVIIKSTEDFISEAKKVHGDKYDYSLVEYKNCETKVKIICPVHGIFEQIPSNHLSGHGCQNCRNDLTKKSTEDFISEAKKVHGDKYDYSLVEYKNSYTKVKIICPIHGIFEQIPSDHLRRTGCPKCHESISEKDIEKILQKENIENITQKTFDWLIYKNKMKLDFYIPSYNIAIECQGIQHFEPIDPFGGTEGYIKTIDRDKKKRELCEQHGIKVFYYANYQYDFPYKVYTDPEELIAEIKKIDPVNNS